MAALAPYLDVGDRREDIERVVPTCLAHFMVRRRPGHYVLRGATYGRETGPILDIRYDEEGRAERIRYYPACYRSDGEAVTLRSPEMYPWSARRDVPPVCLAEPEP
jgi:hypothetical protein